MVLLEEPCDYPQTVPGLPKNYNFEIPKTLKTIKKVAARKVALQFPDGLLVYAPILIDTIEQYTGVDCVILDDVVYGACCVDDTAVDCDLIIHYGHSCLIPVNQLETRVLYVFVDIKIDVEHLYEAIVRNFRGPVAVIGTIQFNATVNKLKRLLNGREHDRVNSCKVHSKAIDEYSKENLYSNRKASEDLMNGLGSKIQCNTKSESDILSKESMDLECCKNNLPVKNNSLEYSQTQDQACRNNRDNCNCFVKGKSKCNSYNDLTHLTIKSCEDKLIDDIKEKAYSEFVLEKMDLKENQQSQNESSECTCVSAVVPQVKPLSPGEVLGCTSPIISGTENVVYLGDGRFHLESAMIRNPSLNFFKYCPYTKKMTQEFYDFELMKRIREGEIKKALEGRSFGVILGSLGRQGNKQIQRNVVKRLESMKRYKIYQIVMDEINQSLLDNYPFIDSFVQVSCPRLSIDWGATYKKPLLSPFELFYQGDYAMDYYSSEGSAPWKNYNNE